jgi:uncharacterized membrane protein
MRESLTRSPQKFVLEALRWGGILSFGFMVSGLAIFIWKNWSFDVLSMSYNEVLGLLKSQPMGLEGVNLDLSSRHWMNLGLWVLVLTPALRVLLSCIHFAKEKDRFYFGITVLVLLLLGASIFLGALES